jgi:hypothetical protein
MVVCAAPGLPSGWCGLSRWASVADHGALSVGHGEHRRWVGGHVLVESPPPPFPSNARGQVRGLLNTGRKLCQAFPTGRTMLTPSGADHLIGDIVVVLGGFLSCPVDL